jgi:hypothetical protein
MKLKFYSFRDALTNGYSQPFLQNNRAQAVRTARWKADESKPNEIEDISLVELGEFDTETGYMSEAAPEHIARLIDLKETTNVKS